MACIDGIYHMESNNKQKESDFKGILIKIYLRVDPLQIKTISIANANY